MIQNYKISNINNEEVLYLYFDYMYEFGSIGADGKKIKILDQVGEIIKNIGFTGEKIVVMAGTIAIATLLFTGTGFTGKIMEENIPNYFSSNILLSIQEQYNFNEVKNSIPEDDQINQDETINKSGEILTNNSEIILVNEKSNVNTPSPVKNNIDINTVVVENTQIEPHKPVTPEVSTPVEAKTMVTVYRSSGIVLQIELEEYLIGVVAAEMPASFNIEALKAQAIVARTYALKRITSGLNFTDTVSTQEYKDVGQMKIIWQGEFQKYYDKVSSAVASTKNIYITYNGNYIDAVYHSTSNGFTQDSVNVWGNNIPYLKSVESSWDKTASSYLRTETVSASKLSSLLGIDINSETSVEIISRDASGRVSSIKINNNTYTGVYIRNLLGLRSTDFDIVISDNNFVITTRGYGHGVGMSQYGANGMANSGYSYRQILNHYYQGIQIN